MHDGNRQQERAVLSHDQILLPDEKPLGVRLTVFQAVIGCFYHSLIKVLEAQLPKERVTYQVQRVEYCQPITVATSHVDVHSIMSPQKQKDS